MVRVDLIPVSRRLARQRRVRVRIWGSGVTVYTLALVVVYAMAHSVWSPGDARADEQYVEASLRLERAKKQVGLELADLGELQRQWVAIRTVGSQPDWSVLLARIAGDLGEQALLTSVTLSPSDRGALKAAATSRKKDPKASDPPVVGEERYLLSMTGLALSQHAVHGYVDHLEKLGVFDRVSLIETRRVMAMGKDAVQFSVECELGGQR